MAGEETKGNIVALYKQVFNSPNGKLVFQDLCTRFGMFHSSYAAGDPHGTSFNEGQRSVMLYINESINFDLKAFRKNQENYISEF
jgi:hypothetical protein